MKPPPHKTSREDLRAGVALMVLAMAIIPAMDTIAKHLTGSLSAGQIAASRFAFQALMLLPFVFLIDGFRVGPNLWKHVLRGILMMISNTAFFFAFRSMPMADTLAIFFVEPLILTVLAALILNEHVGWRRIAAVLVGLAGSMLIIRPSFAQFGMVALLPLLTACAFAFYLILTRTLTKDTGTFAMQFYVGVFGLMSMLPALAYGEATGAAALSLRMPSLEEWGWLAALAIIGTSAHLLIVQAIRRMGAGLVAPFQYLEIVGATIFGYIFFGDFPALPVWIGVTVVVGSGLYVFHREHKTA